jgi:hypothetical protein
MMVCRYRELCENVSIQFNVQERWAHIEDGSRLVALILERPSVIISSSQDNTQGKMTPCNFDGAHKSWAGQ